MFKSRFVVPLLICVLLGALTWIVFGQTLRFEFLNYDDDSYVYDNPHVTNGLTWHGIVWAATHVHSNNWHPLTTLSHMVDCQLYGLKPWGHHLSNVFLHSVTVILCFLVLWRMTGAMYRSAFVAAIFAIHPLHVESVAWISERKDVLSGLFFMLTLGAYVRYARKPSLPRYLVVTAFFAAGLMSKPMLVTIPLVLLLLDFWPLRRFRPVSLRTNETRTLNTWKDFLPPRPLILEKLPLFALSALSCAATIFAQTDAISSIEKFPFNWRIKNAFVSLIVYLWDMIWPSRLAVFYPHPKNFLPVGNVFLAIVLIAAITAFAFRLAKTRPYMVVGWLWYLVMLVPVIGILQVGLQAHADRYTYLPQIGLYIALTWAIADMSVSWPRRNGILIGVATVVIATFVYCARIQASYWRDSESLWRHALAVTPDNVIARHNLGFALGTKGRLDEATMHVERALQFDPDFAAAHNNLAIILTKKGRLDEAVAHYQTALRIKPDDAVAQYNLASVFIKKGALDEAIAHYQKAIQINPEYAEAHNNLGNLFLQEGHLDEAAAHYREALKIKPGHTVARNNLALILFQKGNVDDAIACWQKSLTIEPKNRDALNNLGVALLKMGKPREAIVEWQKILQFQPNSADPRISIAWVLATSPHAELRDGSRALHLAQEAQQLSHENSPIVYRTLAAALAECGRFNEAVEAAQHGLELASIRHDSQLMKKLQNEIDLYRTGSPLREDPAAEHDATNAGN
jgi:tetratricopeptide (TPR) repeat protein